MDADGLRMTDIADNAQADIPGWEGLLDPGERIVWQGRPDQGFDVPAREIPQVIFALFFAGFAVFWMSKAAQAGGGFWMFGLIHFSVGLGIAGKALFGTTLRRRRSWYTLTDRRAFIATDLPMKGRELKSYPLTPDSPVSYRAGPLATIHFARERRTGDKGRIYTVNIGFERIADGEAVVALIRDAQRRGEDT
jgi:hypothetical protein